MQTTMFAETEHSLHPVIIGEAPDKSSTGPRDAWPQSLTRNKLDRSLPYTCLSQDHFQMVAERFMAATPAIRSKMMFWVAIIFHRNAHEVPVFVRLTDIIWAQASFSATYLPPTSKSRPLCLESRWSRRPASGFGILGRKLLARTCTCLSFFFS
jgi:hypothetical protein